MRRPRSAFALAVSILAGFLNRRQQDAIDYLREENRVLREMVGGRRLRFSDPQRKRLAIRGKALGRALLKGIATLVLARTRPGATTGSRAHSRILATPSVRTPSRPSCFGTGSSRLLTGAPDTVETRLEPHYLEERNHQGVGNELIDPVLGDAEGVVARRERLGGLLNDYYLRAA